MLFFGALYQRSSHVKGVNIQSPFILFLQAYATLFSTVMSLSRRNEMKFVSLLLYRSFNMRLMRLQNTNTLRTLHARARARACVYSMSTEEEILYTRAVSYVTFTVVLLKIQVLWNAMLRRMVQSPTVRRIVVLPSSGPGSPRKLKLPDPEDDGLKILPNIISIYHSEERNIP